MFTAYTAAAIAVLVSCSLAQFIPPEALVESLKPKGIRISIPDEEGITLVAFHVKFNEDFDGLEAGTIARDTLKPKNDRWMYEDNKTSLRKGDVVYYWIHVVYRGLGYNLYDQKHTITEEEANDKSENTGIQGPFVPPEALVEPLKPRGIRISIPHDVGNTLVAFHIKINEEFNGLEAGLAKDFLKPKNDRWTYQDKTTVLKQGDVVYYWIHVVHKGLGYNLIDQKHVVTEFFDIDGHKVDPEGNNEGNNNQHPPCAKPSTTKLYDSFGKSRNACAGDLIFEDNFKDFSQLTNKWTVLTQFSGSPDYEFVVYRNSPFNLKVKNGLKITPTLLSNEFNTSYIQSGDWELQSCTETPGSVHCHRKAMGWNILPPVGSARINTKKTFNFEYGRIEVRAKLPNGDWIHPLILLEPVNTPKGSALENTQFRVASSFGNSNLQLKNGEDIGGHILLGGVTGLNGLEQASIASKYNNNLWSSGFHTYELTWRSNEIVLKVDGKNYGQLPISLPRNSPVYLTFGVAVGGLSTFPDQSTSNGYVKPWRNVEAKALYNFYKSTDVWLGSWKPGSTLLDVEYVKVYAL